MFNNLNFDAEGKEKSKFCCLAVRVLVQQTRGVGFESHQGKFPFLPYLECFKRIFSLIFSDNVLFMFEKHCKPTQSVLQSWYQLGSIYSSQCKDQTEFMSKLHDVANDCSFANKDETVFSYVLSITQMGGLKIS